EPGGLIDFRAAGYALLGEKAAADHEMGSDLLTHPADHLQWQAHAALQVTSIPIRATVRARKKGSHRVGVRKMELDAIEPGLAGTAGRACEQTWKLGGQVPDVGQVS